MCVLYCRHDPGISSASANVAAHALTNLVGGEFDVLVAGEIGSHEAGIIALSFFEHGGGGTELAGRAIAALETIVIDEGCLQSMKIVATGRLCEAFDSGDVFAVVNGGER